MHKTSISDQLQQANEYVKNQQFGEAIQLYKEILINNPQLAQEGLSIRLAHCILLSVNWLEISRNLISDTNYLEASGWLNSLSQSKPVNAENRPIPWYTYPAIEFIEDKIKREFLVI